MAQEDFLTLHSWLRLLLTPIEETSGKFRIHSKIYGDGKHLIGNIVFDKSVGLGLLQYWSALRIYRKFQFQVHDLNKNCILYLVVKRGFWLTQCDVRNSHGKLIGTIHERFLPFFNSYIVRNHLNDETIKTKCTTFKICDYVFFFNDLEVGRLEKEPANSIADYINRTDEYILDFKGLTKDSSTKLVILGLYILIHIFKSDDVREYRFLKLFRFF